MRLFELTNTKNITVFYGGRFQPMHKGHRDVYKHLVDKFGANNVFIATMFSQKAAKAHAAGDYSSDPFTFKEKAELMTKMHGIPANKIIDTNPFRPDVTKTGRDPSTSAVVLVYGAKDAGRLNTTTGALRKIPDDLNDMQPADEIAGYVYVAPLMQGGMSASDFRSVMATGKDQNGKAKDPQKTFVEFFGSFNQDVFDFIKGRLTNG